MVAGAMLRERGFAEAKRLCYAGLDAPTLLGEVTGRLRRVVPFEALCAQTNDPLSGLPTQTIGDGPIGEREHRTYLEHIYFTEDLDDQRRMVQRRIPVARLSDATGGRLERALHWREISGPLGLGHEVLGVCTVGRALWGKVCLARERGRPDFEEREVALVERIAPHLGAGLQAAVLRARATAEPVGDSAPGVLALDDHGRVVQHTATAERWLREVAPLGPDWLEGDGLPAPVWMVVGALRRALTPGTERELHEVPRVRVRARSGRWLTFHGARTEPRAGRAGETIVVVEPSRPEELAWLRASAYGLSARERAVVDRVVQGAATKEIARALAISEYTVQEHLSHAFDKVGVRGRHALVKRLFFDLLHPALDAPSGDDRLPILPA